MNDSEYCSCEKVAHGDLGLIEPSELVSRVVCDPRHVKQDGSLKPGIIPPSHIKKRGLSLMRRNHLSNSELKRHADAVASHNKEDIATGVIEAEAKDIRELTDSDGKRIVCLFDDPTDKNPAHAILVAARDMNDEDITEIRTRLVTEVFGSLRPF